MAQNTTAVAAYVLPKLGDRPIAAITKMYVVQTLSPIWHSKHVTAKCTLGRLREILELANLNSNHAEKPAVFCHRMVSLQAQRVLVSARVLAGGERLVFAKPSTVNGTISENAILNLAKCFDPVLTGPGFRASFKTWARRHRKYDFDAVEYALAHVPNKLEKAYMRDDLLDERREIMQDWADYVSGAPAVESQK